MDEVLIRYKDVADTPAGAVCVERCKLELHKGEFVYLIGKVGSGKTSLLKTFYGELDVAAGDDRKGVGILYVAYQAQAYSAVASKLVSYFRISSCSPTVRCMTILSSCSVPPGGRIRER